MSITASIIIERDNEMFTVELSGSVEYFGSANPYERGQRLGDWYASNPFGFKLTANERERAELALEEQI